MPVHNPSKPLVNNRHEVFAQRLARGASYGDAWKATVPFGKEYNGGANALRVTGFRVAKRPEVEARVSYLRQQAKREAHQDTSPLTQGDIIRLNLEVTEALETAYKAAEDAHVAPQKLETLRRVLAAHLGRQGKLSEGQQDKVIDHEDADILQKLSDNMSKVCRCQI